MKITKQFDRPFQVWSYTVSHGQLLLRSTKTAQARTRVDVLFKNVAVINLASNLDTLSIQEVSADEIQMNHPDALLQGRKVFRIASRNFTGYVVAGAVVTHEDDREYGAPSALLPS